MKTKIYETARSQGDKVGTKEVKTTNPLLNKSLINKSLKKYIADSYFDGRFGTSYGEQHTAPRTVWAHSPKQAFEKAFGFAPRTRRIELGTGYRYVNEEGLSLSAACYRVVEQKLSLEEIAQRYAGDNQ